MADQLKIPLPKFLALFTSNNVPVHRAMAISAKIYKEFNTPAKLSLLDDAALITLGIESKDERKLVVRVMRDSGHLSNDPRKARTRDHDQPPTQTVTITPAKGKRKRTSDANPMLPTGPADDQPADLASFDFGEILDEEVLKRKSTIINRAPIITAWAMVVAERMGFKRGEALSIASVYTEMNAVSKGVGLGIHKRADEQGMEAVKGGSQSYVELMGRRPLYRTQADQWRSLLKGNPVSPKTAFNYICRALHQTTPFIIGALRLLAGNFTNEELKDVAWGLYAEFRPPMNEWGKQSEVKCSTILSLRQRRKPRASKVEINSEDIRETSITQDRKRMKIETPENQDIGFVPANDGNAL